MTPAESGALLLFASAFDNRQPSEPAALAWSEALDERVTLADARGIIAEHYARSRDWIMPSDINVRGLALRKTRLDRIETPQPPETIDPDDVARNIRWTRAYVRLVGDGIPEVEATAKACAEVGVNVPAQLEAVRRPEYARLAMLAHGPQCQCGCLTKPIRPEEGAA
jgi:hypothetical protein